MSVQYKARLHRCSVRWEIPVWLWNKRINNKAKFPNFSPQIQLHLQSCNFCCGLASCRWFTRRNIGFFRVILGNVQTQDMVQVQKLEKHIDFVFSAAVRFKTWRAVLLGYLAMLGNNHHFKWWYFSELFNENLIHFLLCGEHFIFVLFISCFLALFTHVVIVE